jgi:hypothetical protein
MDGVIDLGKSSLGVRRYRVLRIPKALVERYLTSKAGRSISITVPESAEHRRKSPKQAFGEVCKIVDSHPELWERPSREAVVFAVDALWKRKD